MATAGELYGRPWSEREYIIVLHQYFLHQNEPRHAECDYVKKVAHQIGRTPAAVSMRMENYASIDPMLAKPRTGLSHINAIGRKAFEYWSSRREALAETAEAFIRDQKSQSTPSLFDPFPVRLPRAFDRYELVDEIGQGALGTVFSCIEVRTQQLYAIKIIRADKIHDDESLHRFRREIRALKSRGHRNVIRLHEDNLDSERTFPAYVMDYAKHSLTSFVQEIVAVQQERTRPVCSRKQAIEIVTAVCDAVEALHNESPRLLHRDINPNNILVLPDGSWVLADFGLAKFVSSAPMTTSFRTTTQHGWGTQWYTAPEQYTSFRDVDERSDIYSLGVLIWEMFTESGPPFEANHLGLSKAMTAAVLKATDRDRSRRYQSVAALRTAFEGALAES